MWLASCSTFHQPTQLQGQFIVVPETLSERAYGVMGLHMQHTPSHSVIQLHVLGFEFLPVGAQSRSWSANQNGRVGAIKDTLSSNPAFATDR